MTYLLPKTHLNKNGQEEYTRIVLYRQKLLPEEKVEGRICCDRDVATFATFSPRNNFWLYVKYMIQLNLHIEKVDSGQKVYPGLSTLDSFETFAFIIRKHMTSEYKTPIIKQYKICIGC